MKSSKEILKDLLDAVRWTTLHITSIPEEIEKEQKYF